MRQAEPASGAPQGLPRDWREQVAAATGAPHFLLPWLDRLYDLADAALVLRAARAPHEPGGLAGVSQEELDRAWRRCVLDRLDDGRHTPAGLHTRLEYWALFEGWLDVPRAVRDRVCEWDAAWYVEGLRERVERLRSGEGLRSGERCACYLLLDEAERLLRRAPHVYLWPCNCRSYVGGCRKPSLVCLRFQNDRGIGWEISTDRAFQILHEANRRGLMQVGEVPPGDGPVTVGAICNCCVDCCYEQQAGRALDAARLWPRVRYAAELPDDCSGCGRCSLRCPFGAISMRSEREAAQERPTGPNRPLLAAADCRGCGLCSTGCPDGTIRMRPIGRPSA